MSETEDKITGVVEEIVYYNEKNSYTVCYVQTDKDYTAVVGYLAIMDLTRASDIVTARTLDAMFGIVSVAVLYLIIGWVGSSVLNILAHQKHLGGDIG